MFEVTFYGVDGKVWPLTAVQHRGVFLKENPVELRTSGEEAVAGSLELVVADNDPEGRELHEIADVMREWRGSWSRRNYGTLRIEDSGAWESWLPLRLAEPIPDLPSVDPAGYEEFTQAVVSDPHHPYWRRTHVYDQRTFTVTNAGDHETWPRVRWKQGGTVTLPSGVALTLPTVGEWRTIFLDPFESLCVLDDKNRLDRALWRQLRHKVYPEPIPVGEVRTFGIPAGAQLIVDERVDDPWR